MTSLIESFFVKKNIPMHFESDGMLKIKSNEIIQIKC